MPRIFSGRYASGTKGKTNPSIQPITLQISQIVSATGAGDYFLACHIINDLKFADKKKALKLAAKSAASYVRGEH